MWSGRALWGGTLLVLTLCCAHARSPPRQLPGSLPPRSPPFLLPPPAAAMSEVHCRLEEEATQWRQLQLESARQSAGLEHVVARLQGVEGATAQ